MDLQAKNALSKGDTVGASQFATQASNLRQAQAMQDWKKTVMQTGQINNQQKLFQNMESRLAPAADQGPEEFNRVKMQLLAEGHGNPDDQQNLANLEWSEGLGNTIRMGAMTARQQAQTIQAQQNADSYRLANQDSLIKNREIRLSPTCYSRNWH